VSTAAASPELISTGSDVCQLHVPQVSMAKVPGYIDRPNARSDGRFRGRVRNYKSAIDIYEGGPTLRTVPG